MQSDIKRLSLILHDPCRDGEVISSKEAKVLTGYAYGTWKGTTLRKPGNYTIAIKLGDEVLGSAKVTVKE